MLRNLRDATAKVEELDNCLWELGHLGASQATGGPSPAAGPSSEAGGQPSRATGRRSQQGIPPELIPTYVARTKTSTRQYLCKVCDYHNSNRQNVLSHTRSQHLEGAALSCSVCGHTFFATEMLDRHMRDVHTNPRKKKRSSHGEYFHLIISSL